MDAFSLWEGGRLFDFRGEVLSSIPDGDTPVLDALIVSSAIRPAFLSVPVAFTCAGTIEIQIDGVLAATATVPTPPPGEPIFKRILIDLSSWLAGRKNSRLRIVFRFAERGGTATVFVDSSEPSLSITLEQPWLCSHVAYAVTFLALQWITMFAILIIVAANIPWFNEEWESYAFLGTAVIWLASVLGIADLAKLPIKQLVRQVLGWSLKNRRLASLILGGLAFLSVAATVPIVYCVTTRARYARLIEEYSLDMNDPAPLADAFALVPWRTEARFLIERHAWLLRRDKGHDPFRSYVRSFVLSRQAAEALTRIGTRSHCFCVYHVDKNVIGPVEWFASMMPEGDREGEDKLCRQAIDLLKRTPGTQSEILRRTMEFDIATDKNSTDRALSRIQTLLREPEEEAREDEFFQVGADHLAQADLADCSQNEALDWFKTILEIRMRARKGDHAIEWLRPPEKLLIYYMYLGFAGRTNPSVVEAMAVLDKCSGFHEKFKTQIYDAYAPFKDPDAWTEGTPFDPNLKMMEYVNNQLPKGWRY